MSSRFTRAELVNGDLVDVVRMMPHQFVDAYEALCVEAYNSGGGIDGLPTGGGGVGSGSGGESVGMDGGLGKADGRAQGQWRTDSGVETTIGTVKVGKAQFKRVGKTGNGMRDERAFRMKTRVDKRLRSIAREILANLYESEKFSSISRVCTGRCKRIGESDWLFCARCGGPMTENDSQRG